VTSSETPLLRKVDAVTFSVPDLDEGLRFYEEKLGHPLRWRNDEIGQARPLRKRAGAGRPV